jgi:hypothetical protein
LPSLSPSVAFCTVIVTNAFAIATIYFFIVYIDTGHKAVNRRLELRSAQM